MEDSTANVLSERMDSHCRCGYLDWWAYIHCRGSNSLCALASARRAPADPAGLGQALSMDWLGLDRGAVHYGIGKLNAAVVADQVVTGLQWRSVQPRKGGTVDSDLAAVEADACHCDDRADGLSRRDEYSGRETLRRLIRHRVWQSPRVACSRARDACGDSCVVRV